MNKQITASTREVEGIHLLGRFKNNLVQIDFNLSIVELSKFIENLSIEITDKYIILDSFSEDCTSIYIKKETILEIDEENSKCITIYVLGGDITLTII